MTAHNTDQHSPANDFTLCSQEYMRFLRIACRNYTSDHDLFKALTEAFPPLAEKLHIGYFCTSLSAPKSIFAPKGQHTDGELFGTREQADLTQAVQSVFQSGENGTFSACAFPAQGTKWSEQDMDHIRFISETLFLACGRSRMAKLLTRALSTDFQTGVLNMAGFRQYAEKLVSMDWLECFVGMFLNLRHFKFINRSVGQEIGDEIMRKYTQIVKESLRPDERIARAGGDNFVLLVRRENAGKILELLQEVIVTVAVNGSARTFPITSRVGIYDIQPGDAIDTVLNHATIALNVIKQSGMTVNQIWYTPAMQEKMMHDKQISQLFPASLRHGEFRVFYQPKVTLENQTLCGCEALCRWFHNGQIVPPMEFIPILEQEGSVCALDFYVFERVCQDLRNWLDHGIDPVRVSVNFSQQHLRNPDLASQILEIMRRYQIESKFIEIELTEMSTAKNHDAMIIFFQKMRENGICTSIDDFGTGYSSLNMLREFQMNIIKLDKSFLDRILTENPADRTDEIIVENIIHLVQSLHLEIISEGVETAWQANFLKRAHCNMAQGYLFDKPLPHDEFEKRLAGSRRYSLRFDTMGTS